MRPSYLLFVDTETTGLPADWQRPYEQEQAWPCLAQLAWQVYTEAGELVKQDAAYLPVPPGRMSAAAVAVHGLTPAFLAAQGEAPALVLRRFLADLRTYQPRVIAHFLLLDFHVLGAALHRAGEANPLPALPQFCTMQASTGLTPRGQPLRLAQLHERLFGEPLARLHDARTDAAATARCFFELRRRGLITPTGLSRQRPLTEPRGAAAKPKRGTRFWLLLGAALLLLYWLLHG